MYILTIKCSSNGPARVAQKDNSAARRVLLFLCRLLERKIWEKPVHYFHWSENAINGPKPTL